MELSPTTLPEQRPLEDGGRAFPLALGPSAVPGEALPAAALAAWCGRNAGRLQDMALQHGAVLMRGCGIRGAEDLAAVTRALGCEAYDYVGGAAPRTELVPGLVFTSNESPPEQPIPFHHELAQAPDPPSYLVFYCERAPTVGGATPIIPSAEVAAFFERRFPDFARRMEQLGVRYIRVMPEVTDTASALGRSWKETYNVSTREEAEVAMRQQGTSFEWLPNGDCRTVTAVLPALRVDWRTGKRVFFNSVIAAFTGWYDARNDGKRAVVLGDGSPVDGDALEEVARFMQQRQVAFAWQAGDVLLVDNTLVMHARQSFEPPRRVLAALRGPPLGRVGCAERAPLRIGIVGTGAMGKEHIRNIELLGESVGIVVAVSDSNQRARAEAMEELGGRAAACAVFEHYQDLLMCDFVDAVIVCTPNYTHIDVLRSAIPTGKHILCEKPLCTTLADCYEVEELLKARDANAKKSGERVGIFMTGMEYRWMPPIAQLIRETDSGEYGAVRLVSIREHRFPFLVKVNNWNRFDRFTGGTLVEKACHFFDLMRRIVWSEPISVYASGGQAMNHKDEVYGGEQPDIIDHALVVVEFKNGVRASLDLCMFAEDEQTEHVTAVCERGKIEAMLPESVVRIVRRRHISGLGRTPPAPDDRAVPEVRCRAVAPELAAAGYHEGATFFELREFVEASQGLRPVPVTAHDGTLAVTMGLAAQESISTGRVVPLPADRSSQTAGALADPQHTAEELIALLPRLDQPRSHL